jgi:hypothetical protein
LQRHASWNARIYLDAVIPDPPELTCESVNGRFGLSLSGAVGLSQARLAAATTLVRAFPLAFSRAVTEAMVNLSRLFVGTPPSGSLDCFFVG